MCFLILILERNTRGATKEIARYGDIYLRIEDSKLMLVPANDCRIHGRQRPDRLNHVRLGGSGRVSAPTLDHITTIDCPCISGIVLQTWLRDGDGPMTNGMGGG